MTSLAVWLPFALLFVASVCDLRSREIPDAIPALILVWTLVLHLLQLTPVGAVAALAGLGLGAVLAISAFHVDILGGGDAKLLIALGALLGLGAFCVFLIYVALAGGVLALIAKWRGQQELPYAPAFALGWLALVVTR